MPLAQVPTIFEFYPKIPPQNKMLIDAIIGANELGRVFVAPPGVPGDRATYLEGVLKKVISEREVIDKARTLRLELNYLSGSGCLEPIKKAALTKEARTQLQNLMKKYTE